jgi:hypothetical protein
LKKAIIILTSLIVLTGTLSFEAMAQKRKVLNLQAYDMQPYHFGFILGINHMHFSVKPVSNLSVMQKDPTQFSDIFADSLSVLSVTSKPTPGFTIGILGNLRLGKYGDMRFIPSLSFGERILRYNILGYRNGEESLLEINKSVTSTFIDFPLEFRYKSKRLNNFRAYVLGGVKYTLDLASQKKQANADEVTVKIFKNDVSAEVGVGVEFYTTYFKFGTQVKMGYGLKNLVVNEDNIYTNSIESLRSKVFLLSFTFE